MCFLPKTEDKPAETLGAAPAPPLPPADVPVIGEARKKETQDTFGADAPNYRVARKAKPKPVNPSGNITM